VTWRYFPNAEQGEGAPGVAHEARIYTNGGSGVVDYSAPMDTLYMAGPTTSGSYSWTSAVLLSGLPYMFVVRIATAAWPAGIETQNTDAVSATPNADEPDAVTLSLEVV